MKCINDVRIMVVLSLVGLFGGGCVANYKLTVEDTLARPGEKARLTGRLLAMEATVLNQKSEKQELGFYVDNLLVGINETNRDGYAAVKYFLKKTGAYPVKAIYNARTYQAQAFGRIFVWKPDEPILIVDIESTIHKAQHSVLRLSEEDSSSPAPGAVEALDKLSKQFHIVYLIDQPRENIPRTRTWLEKNDFPAGPVLVWDIEKLQADFTCVRVGIGNTDKGYQAYRERKVFSLLVDPSQPPGRIDGGIRVSDWPAVLKSLRNYSPAGNGP